MPYLPSDRLQRTNTGLLAQAEAPLCFIEKQANAMRLVRVNHEAATAGLEPGLTLADAHARLPHLIAIDMDHAADAAWLGRIADFCDRYTPMTALDGPDGLVLDISGCAHLFGGETALRDDLVMRLSPFMSTIKTAIAGTPQTAKALACFGSGQDIIAPGMEAQSVACLPVSALEASHETVTALLRAGLKTIGDLASRPRAPLAARFGQQLVTSLARILGEENTAITPRRPMPICSAERRFAEPLTQLDDALATLKKLARQTAQSLERRGEGGRRFEAALFRADGVVSHLSVETAQPIRAPEIVMRLFSERIDTLSDPLDPGYGYDLIRLSIPRSAPFDTAQSSLDSHQINHDDVDALIDRLSTRFGRHAIMQFAQVETHIPERVMRALPAGQAVAQQLDWQHIQANERPMRPIHLFERPELIEALAEVPDGPPLKFHWRRVLHEITRAEGPERIEPEWWHENQPSQARDYYCVENSNGHRFWVFREGLYRETSHKPRWFLHGLFA